MVGFLKKRKDETRQPSNGSSQSSTAKRKSLRPSLSLPDLTTPLLDPASWEEVPSAIAVAVSPLSSPSSAQKEATSGASPRSPRLHSRGSGAGTRNRSASVVKVGTSHGFHRPFTPWQVVPSATSPIEPAFAPAGVAGGSTDFRVSMASSWSRHGDVRGSSYSPHGNLQSHLDLARVRSRRQKSKAIAKLNVAVVGAKEAGKTSFIKLLLDSLSGGETSEKTLPGSSPALSNSAERGRTSPTSHMKAHTLLVENPERGFDRTAIRIIDTPGLKVSTSGDGALVKEKERERGLGGILRLAGDRFEGLLREERRVVRRKQGGDEDLVHLLIHLIDARSILRPTRGYDPAWGEKVDWSGVGVWDEAPNEINEESAEETGTREPRISAVELGIIRRLSKRFNILPVISQIDGLTIAELESVRTAARRDIAAACASADGEETEFVGLVGIDDWEEEQERSVEDPDLSIEPSSATFPLAIFVPEPQPPHGPKHCTRKFPWGSANVFDESHSDFEELQSVLFGEQAKASFSFGCADSQALRTRTREVLYEKYRTERLLAARGNHEKGKRIQC